jgi:hypothetical protein
MPEEPRLAEEYLAPLARAILGQELSADGLKSNPDLLLDDAATADIVMCSAP